MLNYSVLVCKGHIIIKLVPEDDPIHHPDKVIDIYPKKKRKKASKRSKS